MQLLNLHFLLGFIVTLLVLLSGYIIYKYLFEYKKVERKMFRMASFPEQNPNPVIEVSLKGRIIYTNPAARVCFPDLYSKGFSHSLFNLAKEKLEDFKRRDLHTHTGVLSLNDRLFELSIFSLHKTWILRIYCTDITETRKKEEIITLNAKEMEEYTRLAERTHQEIGSLETWGMAGKLDSFMLSMPKEIAGGDFYWISSLPKKGGASSRIILAVVDCAGHGLKGAFMCSIVRSLLDRITRENQVSRPSEILGILEKDIQKIQDNRGENYLSALEIALCIVDLQELKLEFAGAKRPLYLVKDGNLLPVKGDSRAIGGYQPVKNTFTDHVLTLDKGDTLYMFSNGFTDQFGGPAGKKLKRADFRQLLLKIRYLGLQEQQESLKKAFEQWKGNQEQVDDMLILGIRLT